MSGRCVSAPVIMVCALTPSFLSHKVVFLVEHKAVVSSRALIMKEAEQLIRGTDVTPPLIRWNT